MPSRLNESVCSVELLNHFLNLINRFSELDTWTWTLEQIHLFYWIVQSKFWTKSMIQWDDFWFFRSFNWAVLSQFIESLNWSYFFNKSIHSIKQFDQFFHQIIESVDSNCILELICKPNQLIAWAIELNSDSWTNQSVQSSCSIQFTNQINQLIQSISWILILEQIQSNSTIQSVNQIIWFIKSVSWTLILEQISPFKWTVHSNLLIKYWASELNYDFWTNQHIQLIV